MFALNSFIRGISVYSIPTKRQGSPSVTRANASLPVSIVCTLTGVTGPVSVSAERQKRWEGLKGQRESEKEKLYEQEYREMKIYLHVPLNKA